MANDIMGMFSNPEDIRAARIDDLMRQQQQISQMGGSMNQLLGQVAAGGGATGALLAEGMGGMFGWQTPEEKRASQIQDMAGKIDMNDPEDLNQFAKALNSLGMTKEAVAVLEKRNAVMEQQVRSTQRQREEEDRQRAIAQGKTRTITDTVMRPMSIGSGKNAQVVNVPTQVQYTEVWNDKKKQWERVGEGVAQGAGGGSASPYGGITIIDPKTGMATMTQGDPAVNGYQEDLTISP